MATENIVIKFSVDKTQLDGAVSSSKTLEAELKKAGVSAEYIDSAMEGVADALNEAGVDAKTFNKALADSATSTKSLRTQLAEAKNEAVRMSQQFGAFSKEAREAAKRAADIKDQIGDLNDTLDALNPEAKLNAFVKLGQGIQGGFQAATGALQVFGVENERITKLAQQFQGVLNLTQGINSVLQLKDVYGQLRLVLGLTTATQEGLAAATVATTVAEEGATVATNTLNASMKSLAATAGPIIIAFAAVIAVIDKLTESWVNQAEASKKAREAEEEARKLRDEVARQYLQLIGGNEKLLELEKERGATELELLKLRLKENKSDREILQLAQKKAESAELYAQITKQLTDNLIERQILEQKIGNEVVRLYIEGLKYAQLQRDTQAAATAALKQQFEAEFNARLSAADNAAELARLVNEIQSKTTNERIKRDLNSELSALQEKRNAYIQFGKDTEEIDAKIALNRKKFRGQERKEFEEDLEAKKKKQLQDLQVISAYGNAILSIGTAIASYNNAQYENEKAQVEDLYRRKVITEEQYQQRLRIIKRKQAEDDKQTQLFAATMAGALALVNALTVTPSSAIPAALATAAITTAINLARIQAAPIPKYKTGTLNVGGGSLDSDGGMHAIIHKGEAVIPADRNRDYHPTIAALFHRKINPSEINSFVQMKLNGTIPNNIQAHISSKDLRGLKSPESVNIRNSTILAKQIGREIARSYDPRMR